MDVLTDDAPQVSTSEMAPQAPRNPVLRGLDVVALAIFLLIFAAAMWFVHTFASNVLFYDQWSDVNVLQHAHAGTLSLGTLWAQLNGNRIFFPNLFVLLLGYTTHLNVVLEDYLSALLWCLATALVIIAHKRRSPRIPWIFYCPVALLFLMPVGMADALFGFNLTWYLVLVGLAGALFFLDREVLTSAGLIGGVALAVLGSYSSLQGLLIWPAGLMLLYLRRRSLRTMLVWIGAGIATTILYFANFDFTAGGSDNSYIFSHPSATAKFFFSVIGNVVDAPVSAAPGAGNRDDLAIGIIMFAIAIAALVFGILRGRSGGSPIGVSLIVFGLLFVASVAIGRTELGLASAGRYSTFALTIWAGSYLAFLDQPIERFMTVRARWTEIAAHRRHAGGLTQDEPALGAYRPPSVVWSTVTMVAGAALVALIAGQVLVGISGGLAAARGWKGAEANIADTSVNIGKASDAMVQTQLGQNLPPTFIREMVAAARAQRLSLFDTAAVARLEHEGLFPTLVTSVLRPVDGSTVSGVVVLDAGVGDTQQLKAVEFRATGPGLHDQVIGTSTQTLYGWISRWDTRHVANGYYAIQSVLVRTDGTTGSSTPITVRVANN